MTNTKKSFFLNSLFLTISTILEKIFFFIINIIVARYLSKENFGEYSTALAFGTFFSIFTNMGVGISSIRAINFYNDEVNENYTSTLLLKLLLSSTTFLLLLAAIFITDFNINTIVLTLILGLVRIFNDFLTSINQLFEAKSRFSISSIYNSLFAFLFLGGTYFVILFNGDYFQLAYTRLIIVLAVVSLAFFHTFKFYKLKFNFKIFKKFTKETIPFSYSVVFSSVTTNFSSFLLPIMHGTIYSGIYNNAYIFFLSLLFIPGNLSRVLIPHLYKHKYEDNAGLFKYAYNTYSKIFSIMSFYIALIFLLYAGPIIILIFGNKYSDSIYLLQLFAFAVPYAFNMSGTIISSLDKQIINSRIDIIAAFINIIISLVLIKYLKAEGAVLSAVFINIFLYIITNGYLIAKKYINYKKTAFIRSTLFLITFICYITGKYMTDSYQLLLSILITSILYGFFVILFLIDKEDISLIKSILK